MIIHRHVVKVWMKVKMSQICLYMFYEIWKKKCCKNAVEVFSNKIKTRA